MMLKGRIKSKVSLSFSLRTYCCHLCLYYLEGFIQGIFHTTFFSYGKEEIKKWTREISSEINENIKEVLDYCYNSNNVFSPCNWVSSYQNNLKDKFIKFCCVIYFYKSVGYQLKWNFSSFYYIICYLNNLSL